MSLPLRERGLKYANNAKAAIDDVVAPFTGAWIEILFSKEVNYDIKGRSLYGSVDWNPKTIVQDILKDLSLPLRERGLKSVRTIEDWEAGESLPLRERGLKYHGQARLSVEAWSLPLRERGLKSIFSVPNPRWTSRSLYGSVDWNLSHLNKIRKHLSRSLYGSVDWNKGTSSGSFPFDVAPFTGAWIEISQTSTLRSYKTSLPLRERGLKFFRPL